MQVYARSVYTQICKKKITMVTDVLYKESMYWISQFQNFRNESEIIKKSILHSDVNIDPGDEMKMDELLHGIVVFNERLDNTEEIILASINNGTAYWPDRCQTCDLTKKAKSTDELFDSVKCNYNDFIELQRSASAFLRHTLL